jgi:hypothetical protein
MRASPDVEERSEVLVSARSKEPVATKERMECDTSGDYDD